MTQPTSSRFLSRHIQDISEAPVRTILPVALGLTIVIAVIDSQVESNMSLGLLYAIPILISALALNRWQVLLFALACALLREQFAPFSWEPHASTRILSTFLAFTGTGLFASEMVRSRRLVMQYSLELKEQHDRRLEAENQVRMLVDSSPAAIVTLDAHGQVELANQAAHEMFAVPLNTLPGNSIRAFLPTVADLLQTADSDLPYRSATNCRGRRANGESFLACVWFATYPTSSGRRLAAIIADTNEDLRDWQETSLQSLLRSSRVLVGSVSHEIRNLCAAIAVVQSNLGRLPGVAGTEDYVALGTLAQTLSRLATVELQSTSDQPMESVDLDHLLDEFRIVVSPTLEAADVELRIVGQNGLPPVQADRHGLLQVLLNLSRNSTRALEDCQPKRITVQLEVQPDCILLRFADSGPGIGAAAKLFQPFQPGAEAMGLGLFVSRAIVRACGGELYHEPSARGCTMCVRLIPFPAGEHQLNDQNSEISA